MNAGLLLMAGGPLAAAGVALARPRWANAAAIAGAACLLVGIALVLFAPDEQAKVPPAPTPEYPLTTV